MKTLQICATLKKFPSLQLNIWDISMERYHACRDPKLRVRHSVKKQRTSLTESLTDSTESDGSIFWIRTPLICGLQPQATDVSSTSQLTAVVCQCPLEEWIEHTEQALGHLRPSDSASLDAQLNRARARVNYSTASEFAGLIRSCFPCSLIFKRAISSGELFVVGAR